MLTPSRTDGKSRGRRHKTTFSCLNCLISESETLDLRQTNRSTAQFDNDSDSPINSKFSS